mmetsp:Transcript_8690/g.26917  ORF Transcript_8690/g.26917 Transcript_8690/m.26917 type:complete len:221 (-) Transcript_8690:865-1527(-)
MDLRDVLGRVRHVLHEEPQALAEPQVRPGQLARLGRLAALLHHLLAPRDGLELRGGEAPEPRLPGARGPRLRRRRGRPPHFQLLLALLLLRPRRRDGHALLAQHSHALAAGPLAPARPAVGLCRRLRRRLLGHELLQLRWQVLLHVLARCGVPGETHSRVGPGPLLAVLALAGPQLLDGLRVAVAASVEGLQGIAEASPHLAEGVLAALGEKVQLPDRQR